MDVRERSGPTRLAGLVLISVALAACAASRSQVSQAANAPHLLTESREGKRAIACMDVFRPGLLVADEDAGTAYLLDGSDAAMPVVWPNGYTARFAGAEVAVVDLMGTVIATTGHRYELSSTRGLEPEKDGMWWGCAGHPVE